jgi:hypothetical protein
LRLFCRTLEGRFLETVGVEGWEVVGFEKRGYLKKGRKERVFAEKSWGRGRKLNFLDLKEGCFKEKGF